MSRRFLVLLVTALVMGCNKEKPITKQPIAKQPVAKRHISVLNITYGPWEHPASLQGGTEVPLPCTALALQPVGRSNTTAEAIQNVKSVQSGGTVVLAGHGDTGSICTGPEVQPYPCPAIGWWNEASGGNNDWGKEVDNLKGKAGIIRLLGCNVGSTDLGLALIQALAKRAQCTVAAPTGLIHCEGGVATLVNGAQWREADKDGNVTIDTTQRFVFEPANSIEFYLDGYTKSFPWNTRQHEPQIEVTGLQSRFAFDSTRFENLSVQDAKRLVRLINFTRSFPIPGALLAKVTGFALIRLTINHRTIDRKFPIYNDVVAQDPANPGQYYQIDSRFTDWMIMRRRAHTPAGHGH